MILCTYLPGVALRVMVRSLGGHSVNQMVIPVNGY